MPKKGINHSVSWSSELFVLFDKDSIQSLWASLVAQLVKNSPANAGDLGSIPGLGRSPVEGKSYPCQYSGLENSMDYSPWGCKELDMTERLSLSLSRVCRSSLGEGVREHEMVGWHHWFNEHEFEQNLEASEVQESLVCCSPWGCKELDMTSTEQQQLRHITNSISEHSSLISLGISCGNGKTFQLHFQTHLLEEILWCNSGI